MSTQYVSDDRATTAILSDDQLQLVSSHLRSAMLGLQNGQIVITVHHGQIIQIDRLLRKRHFKSKPFARTC